MEGVVYCTYCGSNLHPTAYCPKTYEGSAKRLHLRCAYCGGRDHNTDACRKKWAGKDPVRILDRGWYFTDR